MFRLGDARPYQAERDDEALIGLEECVRRVAGNEVNGRPFGVIDCRAREHDPAGSHFVGVLSAGVS